MGLLFNRGSDTDSDTDSSGEVETLDRAVVTNQPQQRRGFGILDSLSARFTQNTETRARRPSFGVRGSGVERIKPAENLSDYRAIPTETPIVRKALSDFTRDVCEPGYRIETEDDTVQEYLQDEWCPQAAVLAGEKHNDLLPFIQQFIYERWRGGDALCEHVRADPSSSSSPITGLHLINPEHVEFVTYEEKNVLVDPDAGEDVEAPMTKRGEKAAYIQYGEGALVSLNRNEIPLSQNDVTRSALDPGAGNLRGTPITETIADSVTGFKGMLRDKEEAIKTKAYGLWSIGFGREILNYSDVDPETGETVEVTDIIEWDEDDQDAWVDSHIEDIEPGAILTHDGEINLDRIEGEVPDLNDDLHFYVSLIVSCLPTPLFIIGFETNINQFVTEKQDKRYQRLIDEEREEMERVFTDLMQRVVERNLVENSHADWSVSEVPDDLEFKLDPPKEHSPILSHDLETIEKMKTYAEAFNTLRGDMPVEMFAQPDELAKLILQLPDEALPDEDQLNRELNEADPELQQAMQDMGLIDGGDSSGESGDGTSAIESPDMQDMMNGDSQSSNGSSTNGDMPSELIPPTIEAGD